MFDPLGEKIKSFENKEAKRKIKKDLPLIVRVDGRSFSTYTRNFSKPFDARISTAMEKSASIVLRDFKFDIAYTQSDEITFILLGKDSAEYTPIFDGKYQKIVSTVAGLTSAAFNFYINQERINPLAFPHFDARAFQVSEIDDAIDVIQWRAEDGERNAISMIAQSIFTHKQLQRVNTKTMISMINDKSLKKYVDYESRYRYGIFLRNEKYEYQLTDDELERIPKNQIPENNIVIRSKIVSITLPDSFNKMTNKREFLFAKSNYKY